MSTLPEEGTLWEHYNGNVYAVKCITNLLNDERYPTTIVYTNVNNGTMWSRRADDWHRSFKPFGRINHTKQNLDGENL